MKLNVVLFTFLFISCAAFSQKLRNKELTLFDYDVDISGEFVEKTSDLVSVLDPADYYSKPKQNKLTGVIKDKIYSKLEYALNNQIESFVLPINSFGKKLKCDAYSYPKGTYNKAISRGDSKYYIKVKLDIDLCESKKDTLAVDEVIPVVKISVLLYNRKSDMPVNKYMGVTDEKIIVKLDENFFNGFVPGTKIDEDNPCFMTICNIALQKLYNTMM